MIVEHTRPHQHVEDLLLSQGKNSRKKLMQLEKQIYANYGKPEITQKAHNQQREGTVYSRLVLKSIFDF